MGEWSKTVGEFGEKTVENFLRLIGWTNLPSNIEIKCTNSRGHSSNGERSTHGLDFYFSYKSPLIDGVLKNVHISVKFTANKYPASPTSKFRSYYDDLINTIECFLLSEEKRNLSMQFNGVESVENIGVLFWLSNDSNTDDDMISRVIGAQTTTSQYVTNVTLVDNKRVDFIYRAIKFAKQLYSNSKIDFHYPSTGKNINPTTKRDCGKILPVEYINTSILPMRIEEVDKGNIYLVLCSIDQFEIGDLKRLIGLSHELCGSWANGIILAFPDYSELHNKNDVRAAMNSFEHETITDKVKVMCYNDSFKSI